MPESQLLITITPLEKARTAALDVALAEKAYRVGVSRTPEGRSTIGLTLLLRRGFASLSCGALLNCPS